ncbi:hypothetical protein ACHAWF_001620 [Thalassiosira exigua]
MMSSAKLLRRTFGSRAVGERLGAAAAVALSAAPVPTLSVASCRASTADRPTTRSFAAAAASPAAAKKKKGKDASAGGDDDGGASSGLSYKERKEATKQKRRDAWDRKQDRLERLKTRRDHAPKDVLKGKFRSWWEGEQQYHDVLRREAKREGKPWRVRVAVMVERLPVVTPDVEPWEREYYDLRDYLMSFGKEYPEETGFMFAPDKPEDHIIPSDEELLAGLPFTPAPRETEADATGEVRTRDRQLKERVYLALRTDAEGNLSGPRWTLPSALARTDETLLSVAERAVAESVGKDLTTWCPSNAPMAVNFRKYGKGLSPEFAGGYFGEKIFYYRIQYDQEDVDEGALKAEDYGWLTRGEMTERVKEERGEHQAKFFHYML